jgi:hypothetical protein
MIILIVLKFEQPLIDIDRSHRSLAGCDNGLVVSGVERPHNIEAVY